MTRYLILPLGGVGQRFIDAGYKTMLAGLKNDRIIDKMLKFSKQNQNYNYRK